MGSRIVAISDTHTFHPDIKIPDGDILVHAGDFTMDGDIAPMLEFNDWLGSLPHPVKIVIAGNHDTYLSTGKKNGFNGKKIITNAYYLEDELLELNGIKFYGSPYTPSFKGMRKGLSFYKDTIYEMSSIWDKIPEETDILITHGPPYGILDQAYDGSPDGFSVGDKALLNRVMTVKPKYHIFGHIHEGYGIYPKQEPYETTFINASVINRHYNLVNKPVVFDYE